MALKIPNPFWSPKQPLPHQIQKHKVTEIKKMGMVQVKEKTEQSKRREPKQNQVYINCETEIGGRRAGHNL